MTDHISREAATKQLYALPCKMDEDGYRWVLSRDVAKMIDEMPAADVRSVVRGRWCDVYEGQDGIVTQTCSACHKRHQTNAKCEMPPLCPNCGAYMWEGAE